MAKPSPNQNSHSKLESRSLESKQFKGIRMRKWGKWVSEIRMPKSRSRIWLGSYNTPETAARAYDFALYCLRGSEAKFNFPDSPPEIPCASSLSPPQIQTAAAKFATEEFQLPSEEDAAFSRSVSKAECSNDGQEILAVTGRTFWDSVLLECLESGKSLNLNDFPPLDLSMDYFGVLFQPREDWSQEGVSKSVFPVVEDSAMKVELSSTLN
jgi:hypothetical protein